MSGTQRTGGRIDFDRVRAATLGHAETIVRELLPDGRREGSEWVALNPRRGDRRVGSFKVNLTTGRWGDFATADRGGDLVSLVAYVLGCDQRRAAISLADAIGIDPFGELRP